MCAPLISKPQMRVIGRFILIIFHEKKVIYFFQLIVHQICAPQDNNFLGALIFFYFKKMNPRH